MTITPDRVRETFKGLENGEGSVFFENVADDVDWTVMGTRQEGFHRRYLHEAGPGSSRWDAASCRALDGQR
jgi:hypothetical protein